MHPVHGRSRQASSAERDLRGPDWGGIRPLAARRKRILINPGETHTMVDVDGAGLITRLWMTTMPVRPLAATRDLVLRFFWDGEDEPSVECSFADFFGSPFGAYRPYVSAPLSSTGGGFNSLFPMPFASRARLQITNEGQRVVDPVLYAVNYYALDEPPRSPLRFHAQWRRSNPTWPGERHTVLDARGAGHFVGVRLDMQNRHRWLGRNPIKAVFPLGMGLGMLEGQEYIWIDDDFRRRPDRAASTTSRQDAAGPGIVGTGTEDYFNAGWYFLPGRFAAPTHGCTIRNWFTGRVSAYRFDVHSPTPFRERIRVAFNVGIDNSVAADYTSVAYWYQTEPHHPFPPLPAPDDRTLTPVLGNVVQSAAILAPVGAMGWAAARHLSRGV